MLADMRLSGTTLETVATCEVRLGCNIVPYLDQRDLGPDFHDFAAHFMTDDPWRVDAAVGPRVPIVNMGIGPAERSGGDADDRIGAAWLWIRAGAEGQSRLRRCFDKSPHGFIVYQRSDSAYPYGENRVAQVRRDR